MSCASDILTVYGVYYEWWINFCLGTIFATATRPEKCGHEKWSKEIILLLLPKITIETLCCNTDSSLMATSQIWSYSQDEKALFTLIKNYTRLQVVEKTGRKNEKVNPKIVEDVLCHNKK